MCTYNTTQHHLRTYHTTTSADSPHNIMYGLSTHLHSCWKLWVHTCYSCKWTETTLLCLLLQTKHKSNMEKNKHPLVMEQVCMHMCKNPCTQTCHSNISYITTLPKYTVVCSLTCDSLTTYSGTHFRWTLLKSRSILLKISASKIYAACLSYMFCSFETSIC